MVYFNSVWEGCKMLQIQPQNVLLPIKKQQTYNTLQQLTRSVPSLAAKQQRQWLKSARSVLLLQVTLNLEAQAMGWSIGELWPKQMVTYQGKSRRDMELHCIRRGHVKIVQFTHVKRKTHWTHQNRRAFVAGVSQGSSLITSSAL